MLKKTILILNVLYFFLSFEAFAQSTPLTLNWKNSEGKETSSKVQVVTSEYQGRLLLFIALESPLANLKSASYLDAEADTSTEASPDAEILIKEKGKKKYLLLSKKASSVKLIAEDGSESSFSYALAPSRSTLQLAPSCRRLNFKVKTTTQDQASFPAMITCQAKGTTVEEVTFSTLEEAEWFGSGAFENAGKGERWKSFIYKDISTLGIWEMSWGSPENKTVGKVLIPKVAKKNPPVPKPSFTFHVGTQYVTGTVKKGLGSTDLAGLAVALLAQYQQEGSWWFLGSGYDLLVLATSKSDAGSNSLSGLGVWGGAEYKMTNVHLRAHAGYLSRAISAPGVGVTSTFEAPRFGGDIFYQNGGSLYGAGAFMAQTSSEGKFDEMTLNVFYQSRFLFGREARVHLTSTSLKASTGTVDVEATWMTLGLSLQF